jgi:hypothetical protein
MGAILLDFTQSFQGPAAGILPADSPFQEFDWDLITGKSKSVQAIFACTPEKSSEEDSIRARCGHQPLYLQQEMHGEAA